MRITSDDNKRLNRIAIGTKHSLVTSVNKMKLPIIATLVAFTFYQAFLPVNSQRQIESRRVRPYEEKCDRGSGRCNGYIEEKDHDFKTDSDKERPPELTRDGFPSAGSGRPGIGADYKPKPVGDRPGYDPKPVGGGGGYNLKPAVDRDDYLPKPAEEPSDYGHKPDSIPTDDDYYPKPTVDRDETYPHGGGGYNRKPPVVRDELKPTRGGVGGGGYNPKPVREGVGLGGYNPKPVVDRDDYDPKPVRGGVGGGGYNPKPVIDRDEYNPKPVRGGGGGGGYNPKPVVDRDEYDPKPVGLGGYNPKPGDREDRINKPGGGGYLPRPVDDDDYIPRPVGGGGGGGYPTKPDKLDLGGYDKPKEGDYTVGEDTGDDYFPQGKPEPVVEGNCICVPYYQCQDGHIVTDGSGIIDARRKTQPEDLEEPELPLDGKFKPPSCGPYHVCCDTPESSTVKPYQHKCGVRNPSGINSRILSPSNKGEADFGEWPWQKVVTILSIFKYNEYPLKVRLGEWDTQTTTEFLAHEDYKVSKIIVHPDFRNTSLWNDIALLRLEEPVLFAPHIDTVCLPEYDEIFSGQNCVVTGWGKDAYKGGTFSNIMKEVALQVIDDYKCEEMLRKTRLGRFFQLHEGFLCAGGEYGLDSCKGDGGGPLVCYRKNKSYALAGIVSWGIDCGQPGVPGVYMKVQKYLDWISKNTGVSLQEYWPTRAKA
ncbi:Phenoloxidase-activating factor 2 like protein [Argiope bruennichi]|uniref:Phenoloxidase-activating factor 2 like protein n=1 Tax=Argiope bruennichi TaxID=94029 RepID=A0A8T0EN82_ARGBR|nr:Phenoloxidase-activating factor 2 like protein [Argiope bruennichi]